jgi:ComF family protein
MPIQLLRHVTWPTLPSPCVVCRQWGHGAFCAACVDRFAGLQPRCLRCGERTGQEQPACGRCLHEPPPFAHTVCATDYAFPWSQAIMGFKFHGQVDLASAFARLLCRAVQTSDHALPDLVLPVPLSGTRLAQRGYNQAWEVAWRVARTLDVPARAHVLLRHLDTPHQVDLGRAERQRNLHQAFMVDPQYKSLIKDRTVALVDDVMTTGATLAACSTCLLRAGAAQVNVWVLARTPADQQPS